MSNYEQLPPQNQPEASHDHGLPPLSPDDARQMELDIETMENGITDPDIAEIDGMMEYAQHADKLGRSFTGGAERQGVARSIAHRAVRSVLARVPLGQPKPSDSGPHDHWS